MVNKKIAATTMTGLFISMILAIGFFAGMFLYLQKASSDHSMTLDSKYNDTYTRLNNVTSGMDNNVKGIQDNIAGMKEGGIGKFVTNGIEGLGNTLKLTASFISTPVDIVMALFIPLDIIPQWVRTLITLSLIGTVVFLVISILKGDQQKL